MLATKLVDEFVQTIISHPREQLPLAEVADFLRKGTPVMDVFTDWKIVKSDNSSHIAALEETLQKRFPPSYRYFVSNYSFPAFEFGKIMLFANTGQDGFWELSKRLFKDPHMSPALLKAGFLQIGNPSGVNYDPICFDLNASRDEHRIVQLDHESVLLDGELNITEEIAPSFIDLIRATVENKDA